MDGVGDPNGGASGSVLPRLLVLASTYPRWTDDTEPGFVHELAKRLVDRFDVTVVGPHAQRAATRQILDGVTVRRYRYAPARHEGLVNNGGIVTNLRRAPWKWLLVPGFILGMVWATWRAISEQKPAVVHAHWLLPQGLIIALLGLLSRRIPPFVVTSHGADLYSLKARPLQALKRWVAGRAAAVTVVSSAMSEELERLGVDPSKVVVQPMGVDLRERFTPDPLIVRSCDELLFVGRLVEKKGLRQLIEAMPRVLASYPSAYLTIVGFGPEEQERREQVQRLHLGERVTFAGAVSQAQLPALYRRAAAFVAPFVVASSGDQEGLGLVSVEAAGCECPVVVSDLPAVRQAFPNPDEVIMVPPDDIAALASAILSVLNDTESAQLRAKGLRRRLAQHLDWTGVAAGYGDLLSLASHDVP